MPVSELLQSRVKHVRKDNPEADISGEFRSTLKIIEQQVRFNLVKYFSLYVDVIKSLLLDRGELELAECVEPLHIYFEFGSCSKVALNLMALGLSRFTALSLFRDNSSLFDDDVEPEYYIKVLNSLDLENARMPKLCKQEVKELISYQ